MGKPLKLISKVSQLLNIEIVTSDSGRICYYAEETGEGYWLTRDDLEYAIDCYKEYGTDAYSHWCSASGKKMSISACQKIFGK